MSQTRAELGAELKAAGGSWEAWADKLAEFRTDLKRIETTHRWPWPAKHDFRFQGAAMQLLRRNQVAAQPPGLDPLDAIVRFDRQLRRHGIDLIVVPIPDKLAVYPDFLSEAAPEDVDLALPVKRLLLDLIEADVEVIDLFAVYRAHRREHGDSKLLYYDSDSHWRNNAAALAGKQIARRLERYVTEPKAAPRYATRPHRRDDGAKADDVTLIREAGNGKPYRDEDASPFILTGDSFSMYNMHLGGHLGAHVALHLNHPLSYIFREGLGPDMPVEFARTYGKRLEGRKVVVWTFISRSLVRGRWLEATWATPPEAADLKSVTAKARITAICEPPDTDAVYPGYIAKVAVSDLVDEHDKPIGDGRALLRVEAMRDRKLTDAAGWKVGQTVTVKLTTWQHVEAAHQRTATGTLDNADLELSLPEYWADPAK